MSYYFSSFTKPCRPWYAALAVVASTFSVVQSHQDAHASWPFERQLGLFRVHADFPLDTVSPLLVELHTLPVEIQHQLMIGPMREPIDVYLFARRDIYQQYMRRYFPDIHVREAMFIKSNSPGNVFACQGPQFAVDVRHECTHAVLHSMLPIVPLWLDEGLAEYYEVAATDRVHRHPYLAGVRRKAMVGWDPSLARLEQIKELDQFGPREYQEAWAHVHLMLHGPETARRALLSYLGELQGHRVPDRLSERLEASVGNTTDAVVKHFRNWRR